MSKLIDQVRTVMRTQHYSYRTEKTYFELILQSIRFHGIKHPAEMGAAEIEDFLSHLAVERTVSAFLFMRFLLILVISERRKLLISAA